VVRATVVGLFVAAAFVLSGCQYLLGGMMGGPIVMPSESFDPGEFGSFDPGDFGSFDPNDPIFSLPPPIARFKTGSATLTVGDTATTLDQLTGAAAIYEDLGSEVGWTDGNGLYVRFYSEPGSTTGQGFVNLDRITDGKHWSIFDPSGCKVTLAKNDATGISGTASCTGLRWIDLMGAGPASPGYVDGENPFDAEITFQAAP
jgi:hypothetical protein